MHLQIFLIHCHNTVQVDLSESNCSHCFNWLFWLGLNCRLDGDCGFLTANLYAKSVFGEDALVNVSIGKQDNGRIGGRITIKSSNQGIARSLSDKISLKQKGKEGN